MSTPLLCLSLQFADASHRPLLVRHKVLKWLRRALDSKQVQSATFCVRIVSQEEGRALNHSFRGKDYATNVLTFDYAGCPEVEADLVLCAPVVEREAQEQGKDLLAHYAHLLVHGALHAQGYDHEKAKDARLMEALEVQILSEMGFANPYNG